MQIHDDILLVEFTQRARSCVAACVSILFACVRVFHALQSEHFDAEAVEIASGYTTAGGGGGRGSGGSSVRHL